MIPQYGDPVKFWIVGKKTIDFKRKKVTIVYWGSKKGYGSWTDDLAQATHFKSLGAAKHAENLVKLKDETVNCAKEMKYINSLVQYASQRGFFGACAYSGHVALGPVEDEYYRDEKGKLRFDYYNYLLNTVYYFHILFQFKNLGYTIRINEKKHDFFILNIPNPPEDLAVSSENLESYKASSPIENFIESVKANAKALYDEFPELFTCQMKQEFGV